ncbi:MAG: LPD7 domain-containing protein [Parasphingorhabdus sp.]|uniref:LPD7 domain-containing protein n=1 Tax=Parasphingorhabdus sp. TaxID=2709688 RepID=UPI0030021359
MIIRIWDYTKSADGLIGGQALQIKAFATANACARYIMGLQLAAPELEAAKLAGIVAQYMTSEQLESERIQALYMSHLPRSNPEDQAAMFAVHAASAGIARLRHIVWSHSIEERVDPSMMAEHRQIIAKVLQVEPCPAIGSDHGDTDYDHHHEAVITVDAETGNLVEFGQGWWKEASQIAIAICEFRSDLTSEPNRRYVADETGVYHTFSDIKVADADGQIIRDSNGAADRNIVLDIQKEQRKFEITNEPTERVDPQNLWDLTRAVEILAKPRILKAQSWDEVHRNLARVGLRYVEAPGGANLEAVQFGDDWADRTLAASAAYPNAAFGKLSKRLGPFEPAADGMVVRPFVMPRYNTPRGEKVDGQYRKLAREQFAQLTDDLKIANTTAQTEIYNADLGEKTNEAIKLQAARAKYERETAKAVAESISIKKKSKSSDRFTIPEEDDVYATLSPDDSSWTRLRRKKLDEQDEWERVYNKRRTATGTEYLRRGRIAFVETENLVTMRSRSTQARIDALKLAQRKFGSVKIMASKRETAKLIALAAEHGIPLDASHRELAEQHMAKIKSDPRSSVAERCIRNKNALRDLLSLSSAKKKDKANRDWDLSDMDDLRQDLLQTSSSIADERNKGVNPKGDPDKEAMRIIDRISRNELTLSSSRYRDADLPYADDPVLQKAFARSPYLLVRQKTQIALEVLERIELQKRRWICAAIISGRVIVNGDTLTSSNTADQRAADFYKAQYPDPTFRRMLVIAQARPERFAGQAYQQAEIRVWQDLCQEEDSPMRDLRLQFAAREMHRITPAEDRAALLAQLSEADADNLRKTRALFTGVHLDWPAKKSGKKMNRRPAGNLIDGLTDRGF